MLGSSEGMVHDFHFVLVVRQRIPCDKKKGQRKQLSTKPSSFFSKLQLLMSRITHRSKISSASPKNLTDVFPRPLSLHPPNKIIK